MDNHTLNNAVPSADSLLKRASLFLEDGEFDTAKEYYNRVLDINPECAKAYIGLLMAEMKATDLSALATIEAPLTTFKNYGRAMQFADDELRRELEQYTNHDYTDSNKFCTKCGKQMRPGDKFCDGCGTPVELEPKPNIEVASANDVSDSFERILMDYEKTFPDIPLDADRDFMYTFEFAENDVNKLTDEQLVEKFFNMMNNVLGENNFHFVADGSKAKKVYGARNYAPFSFNEKPIILYDYTIFGSAKEGWLLTTDNFYSYQDLGAKGARRVVPLGTIRAVIDLEKSELPLNKALVFNLGDHYHKVYSGFHISLKDITPFIMYIVVLYKQGKLRDMLGRYLNR